MVSSVTELHLIKKNQYTNLIKLSQSIKQNWASFFQKRCLSQLTSPHLDYDVETLVVFKKNILMLMILYKSHEQNLQGILVKYYINNHYVNIIIKKKYAASPILQIPVIVF